MALDYVPAKVPVAGEIISVVLQMSTFGVLCVCLTRRTQYIEHWTKLPLAQWLILVIYVDSALFVFATSIIVHGFGINSSRGVCEGGILLCLVCYMTTKILIYYFLVERAYIVGGSMRPRHKTKLWLFNCLFMLLPYTVFVIMNFIWRITYINEQGVCIIGMQKIAMLPLITFEVVVNVYLTLLFILPLRKLHSYKTNANPALNRMAFRSLVGSCATLITSVVNLTVLMALKGEPGWICLMCCNADILFCVLVLHWVSNKEQRSEESLDRSAVGMPGVGTVGSNRSKNRRISALVREEEEKRIDGCGAGAGAGVGGRGTPTAPSNTPTTTNSKSAQSSPSHHHRPHPTITTECKSSPHHSMHGAPSGLIRVLHRRGSSFDIERTGKLEDEVELNNIRVQTIHTREVEVEGEGKRSVSASSDGGDSEWVGSQKGVVGERIV